MAGFFKKIFSFGKKEVVETPLDDEKLAPINWDALKELKRDAAQTAPPSIAPIVPEAAMSAPAPVPVEAPVTDPTEYPEEPLAADEPLPVEVPRPEPAHVESDVLAPAPHIPDIVPAPIEAPVEPRQPAEKPQEVPAAPQPDKPLPVAELLAPIPSESQPAEIPHAEPAEPDVPADVPAPERLTPEIQPSAPVEVPRPEPTVSASPEPVEIPPAEPEAAIEIPAEQPIPTLPEPEPLKAPLPAPEPAQPSSEMLETVPPEVPVELETPPATEHSLHKEPEATAPIPASIPMPSVAPRPTAGKVTVAKSVAQKAEPAPLAAPEPKLSWFQRLRHGLSRSSKELSSNIAGVFTKRKLDEDTLQDLEDVLIRADLGLETAIRITDALSSGRYGKNVSDDEVRAVMADEIGKVLTPVAQALELDLSHKPHVVLVVGVNGTGKTTTIGKLAAKLHEGGLSVMLAAGDTFRAAAIEQLKIWGERTNSPVVSSKLGADAAGLAYDAFEQAKAAGSDVLIIDTAGRLQNKTELMAELEKIVRVLGKLDPEAPHTVLQTVDATTGQNALNQVEIFRNVAGVNGLVMTKLDGTARGGILVGIAAKYKLPVYFIGVGEQIDDLEPFSATDFAKAIAGIG